MKSAKKILSFVLALVLILGMTPLTAMAEGFARTVAWEEDLFTDVTAEDWFYDNVKGLYELGLMIGYGNGLFQPENSISLAETLTVAARIHAISAYGEEDFQQEEPWYQVYADYALEEDLVEELPEDMSLPATRLEFAHILARTMPEEELEAINDVPDGSIPDVAEDAAVYLLYRAGVLMGSDDEGTFLPDSDIKRSEVAAIVTRMILPELRYRQDGAVEDTTPTETAPEETAPETTEPEVTEPEVTEPEVTEPEVTEPEVTEPEVTEPEVTEPAPDVSVSAEVELDENGAVKSQVSLDGTDAKATVPAGVAAQEGTQQLTLTVSEMEATTGNITLGEAETLASWDVHIEGVSADNQVPILVELGMILEPGMNLGNITIYHIEDGVTNAMTQVLTLEELDGHNEFYYDPATGVLTVSMATFSEIAVASEYNKPWEGEFDYSWFTAGAGSYTIANADQLAAFSAIVGGMPIGTAEDGTYVYAHEYTDEDDGETYHNYTFAGETVTLISDINLADAEDDRNENGCIFYPIGYHNDEGTYEKSGTAISSNVSAFKGTFDGNGHIIKNFYQNTWEMKGDDPYYDAAEQRYNDAMGLFGYVVGGTVKNLTVDHFSSDGEFTPTGVIAAYAVNATFENIAITNCNPRVYNTGNGGIIGVAGRTNDAVEAITLKNITVDNTNKISALWGSWDVACGGLVGMYRGNVDSDGSATGDTIHFENCHVAAQIDVNNDVCANYQYYAYRYAGMIIGSIRHNTTDGNGNTIPDMTGVSASGCTVHFGDWNDYYYCELVANTTASYTHDYQFSRLEQVKAIDGTNITYLDGTTGTVPTSGRYNYVVVNVTNDDGTFAHATENATCYHFVDGEIWTHDMGGIQEGVDENGDGEDDLKEDKQHIYLEFNNLFTGYGWGVSSKSIKDYPEEQINILDRDEGNSVTKFEAVNADTYTTDATVTIGELFAATSQTACSIKPANVQVTVSPADDSSTVTGVYTANADDWPQGTLKFSGVGAATISIQDYYFCTPTTITVTIVEPESVDKFDLVFENTDTYLYRVGNANTVALGSLFKAVDGAEIGTVSVAIETVAGDASGSYTSNATWTSGTIQFSGTGVVRVTIDDDAYANERTLYLEVVNATNVTTASFSGNTVLLNDVYPTAAISATGVVYGNGFTVNMENAPITEKNGAVFHLYDGTILKNLKIVGQEFTTVASSVNDTNYGVSAVRAWGTVVIENCYISGCRAAVSVTGTELTIKDSVIANGVYANIDFRSGVLNLHNVTTINEPHAVNGTTILGLGIVGNMTASAGRELNITGTLTQYNWVSQDDCSNIKASGVSSIFDSVFTEDTYASLRYTYNGTTYVNTGILSLCEDFGAAAVTGTPSDYSGMAVTATISGVTVNGYVWAPGQAGTLSDADMAYHDTVYEWTPSNQGTSYVAPSFAFSSTDLEVENSVVQINYESGSSYTLTADTIKELLPAAKYGMTLSYTVSMNGQNYTDRDIVFDATASQTYTITYTILDNLIYDQTGTLTSTTYEVTKDLKVFATVVDKSADPPSFTFYYGTNGSASAGSPHTTQPSNSYASTIKKIGDVYYIMPNVSATSDNAIGSQTIDSETVYYPIVDGINVRSGSSYDYDFTRYYPIFKAVTISDGETTYSYSTTTMPDTVAWVEATIDSGNGASALKDGYSLYNDQYLCRVQNKAGDAESGGTSVVKFSYTALDGNTYYYYVGYRFYDEQESSICVTPDTLVTLADGTQKEIQYVTYEDELLVWDFYTGCYATVNASVLYNHGTDMYTVIELHFSDGTTVKVVGEHEFFDADVNSFVYISEDTVTDYVGHSFVKMEGDGYTTVALESYSISVQETEAYTILSAQHFNAILETMLSLTPDPTNKCDMYFRRYEVGENMTFDEEKMQADIETYGLYTYEDFADYVTYDEFVAFDGGYLKILVGKGLITFEDILNSLSTFAPNH